jgi:RimJ/RimL family protein N-acetyltransferase
LTPGFKLRPLTSADAAQYFELRLSGLEESPLAFGRSAEEYRSEKLETIAERLEELPGERVTLGAFLHSELVGIMTLVRNLALKQRHKADLYAVYVSPQARGQKVGETLLTALLQWARAVPGLRQVHLAVSVPQTAARRLYVRQGFTVYGVEKRALQVAGQDVDEELMALFLDR